MLIFQGVNFHLQSCEFQIVPFDSDILGGGNSIFFMFTPKIGEDEPILTSIFFSNGLVQPPTRQVCDL